MGKEIMDALEKIVRERCESEKNFFGEGIYHHIQAVVKNAARLAERYGGDVEVVTIAAWLHDVASITDYQYYEEHHIWGAKMAAELLAELGYPAAKTELVQACILNHRGSVVRDKSSIEEICVADADAISHFDSVPSLFYLAYVKRGYSIGQGTEFVARKLRRSFDKLSEPSKAFYRAKYTSVMETVLGEEAGGKNGGGGNL